MIWVSKLFSYKAVKPSPLIRCLNLKLLNKSLADNVISPFLFQRDFYNPKSINDFANYSSYGLFLFE